MNQEPDIERLTSEQRAINEAIRKMGAQAQELADAANGLASAMWEHRNKWWRA